MDGILAHHEAGKSLREASLALGADEDVLLACLEDRLPHLYVDSDWQPVENIQA